MSMQSVFDTILIGLRKQGRQSKDYITHGCLYLATNGDKCAVGILVPDGIPLQEGSGLTYQAEATLDFLAELVPEVERDWALKFLDVCQGAHDAEFLTDWLPEFEVRMAVIAADFDLDYTAPRSAA